MSSAKHAADLTRRWMCPPALSANFIIAPNNSFVDMNTLKTHVVVFSHVLNVYVCLNFTTRNNASLFGPTALASDLGLAKKTHVGNCIDQ